MGPVLIESHPIPRKSGEHRVGELEYRRDRTDAERHRQHHRDLDAQWSPLGLDRIRRGDAHLSHGSGNAEDC